VHGYSVERASAPQSERLWGAQSWRKSTIEMLDAMFAEGA